MNDAVRLRKVVRDDRGLMTHVLEVADEELADVLETELPSYALAFRILQYRKVLESYVSAWRAIDDGATVTIDGRTFRVTEVQS